MRCAQSTRIFNITLVVSSEKLKGALPFISRGKPNKQFIVKLNIIQLFLVIEEEPANCTIRK